jgi:hypothetical protein
MNNSNKENIMLCKQHQITTDEPGLFLMMIIQDFFSSLGANLSFDF